MTIALYVIMFDVLKRQLLHDPRRTLFVSLAIATALALVLLLEDFRIA